MNLSESTNGTQESRGERFEFGKNWYKFLKSIDEGRLIKAEESLRSMIGVRDLAGKTFLDVGCGSGLFSLAARRLGAKVRSFDYDKESVRCTAELMKRHFPHDADWTVEQGSILDQHYLEALGSFDVVYAWGVLHHTGALAQALQNAGRLVTPHGGILFVAIYNDQGRASQAWKRVKQLYNFLPVGLRWLILVPAFLRLWGPTLLRDSVRGRPLYSWLQYPTQSRRGMDPWRDVLDWVGGLPFEVAKPEEVLDLYSEMGFLLRRCRTCAGGHGCNEYVFTWNRG